MTDEFEVAADDVDELVRLAMSDKDESINADVQSRLAVLENQYLELEFALLFSGQHDDKNAIVAIHAGAGGTGQHRTHLDLRDARSQQRLDRRRILASRMQVTMEMIGPPAAAQIREYSGIQNSTDRQMPLVVLEPDHVVASEYRQAAGAALAATAAQEAHR